MGILDVKGDYPQKRIESEIARAAYEAQLAKLAQRQKTPGLEDIPGVVSTAYKNVGGGVKGIGNAVLAGLGQVGRVMGSKTGQQIMAGMAGDPYLAQAYLNQAAQSGAAEQQQNADVRTAEMENLRNLSEQMKQRQGEEADINKIKTEFQLQSPFKQQQLALQERQLAQEKALAEKKLAFDTQKSIQEKIQKQAELAAKPKEEIQQTIREAAKTLYTKGQLSDQEFRAVMANPEAEMQRKPGILERFLSGFGKKTPQVASKLNYTLTEVK